MTDTLLMRNQARRNGGAIYISIIDCSSNLLQHPLSGPSETLAV
jgi:predicted outer membrane repeat protein